MPSAMSVRSATYWKNRSTPSPAVDLHGRRLDVGDVGAVLLRVQRELDRLLGRARGGARLDHGVGRDRARLLDRDLEQLLALRRS